MRETYTVYFRGEKDEVARSGIRGVLEDMTLHMQPCDIWLRATRTGRFSGPHGVTSAMTALQDHGHIQWDVYIDCR